MVLIICDDMLQKDLARAQYVLILFYLTNREIVHFQLAFPQDSHDFHSQLTASGEVAKLLITFCLPQSIASSLSASFHPEISSGFE